MAAATLSPTTHEPASKDVDSTYSASCKSSDIQDALFEDRLPQQEAIDKAADCEVLNASRQSFKFSSLYAKQASDAKQQRHLFIFVRHFFCGLCQDYIRELNRLLPPSSLPSHTQISIVGCGSPDLIPHYANQTGCPYPLYTDESTALFDIFAMTRNLSMGNQRPEYQTHSSMSMIADSLAQSLSSGMKVFSGGSYSQLGGEMLFEDGEVVWCHRMRNTRDHTELAVLKEMLQRR